MNRQATPAATAGAAPAWHTLAIAEAGERLRCTAQGLASVEAQRRLAESGPNRARPR